MLQFEFNAVQVGLELGPIFGPIRQLERELEFSIWAGGVLLFSMGLLIGLRGYAAVYRQSLLRSLGSPPPLNPLT